MGDRGNIVIRQGETNRDDVWFYTHWSGSDIKDIVANALALRQRWDDSSYLARIVFDKLTAGDKGTTGFGISTAIGDNEHPIVVVDCERKAVWFITQQSLKDGRIPDNYSPVATFGFEQFIQNHTEVNV